jgi:hypothetical protein
MVYRTSSGSKMRAPMILSGTSSVVSNVSVSGAGGGGVGGSIGRSNGLVGHSDSVLCPQYQSPILTYPLYFLSSVIPHSSSLFLDE